MRDAVVRNCIVALAVIVGALVSTGVLYEGWVLIGRRLVHNDKEVLEQRISGQNLEEVVDACRGLIVLFYAAGSTAGPVTMIPRGAANLPRALRTLDPEWIEVTPSQVTLLMAPDRRIYLLVYPDGVEGEGTRKLADGLWYWNGRRVR